MSAAKAAVPNHLGTETCQPINDMNDSHGNTTGASGHHVYDIVTQPKSAKAVSAAANCSHVSVRKLP